MKKILKFKSSYLLIAIVVIGLFFRIYRIVDFYPFDHDQDLYSWIAKDILVNGHLRLIGQITSIEGVFIGPFYYYVIALFYALFNFKPLAATIPALLIGIGTLLSINYVFTRLFNKQVGIIGTFIAAVSFGLAYFDRWVVPTQPTILWSAWFLYALFRITKKDTSVLPLIALLAGFIWHVHIALLPLLLLFVITYLFHFKKPTRKQTLFSVVAFLVPTIPFWAFELRHHFLQTSALINNVGAGENTVLGYQRLIKIIAGFSTELHITLFDQWNMPVFVALIIFLTLLVFLRVRNILDTKKVILIISWIGLIFLAQLLTKKPISEYYFVNSRILFLLLVSLFLSLVYNLKHGKFIVLSLGVFYLLVNFFILQTKPINEESYLHKEEVVDFIKADAAKHNYSCVGVNFITHLGGGTGFRYLLWRKGIDQVKPGNGVPIYNVVIPYKLAVNELDAHYGAYGIILPKEPKVDPTVCDQAEYVLTPLLGYTE